MKTTAPDVQDSIDVCNSLLRGEISAIETYAMAIDKYQSQRHLPSLVQIRDEHVESANSLRETIRAMGGEPDRHSGAWGTFAKSVQGAANFFGENSAIQALQQGEEHGRNTYAEALESEAVLPECKAMIQAELLPRTEQHLAILQSLRER